MFCPSCNSEYRPGIERCPTCDVPLRREASGAARSTASAASFVAEIPDDSQMVSYCGFLTLEEARGAREQLRERRVVADILIREAVSEEGTHRRHEEYWLRVPASRLRVVEQVLGFEGADEPATGSADDGDFACSDCGRTVSAHETFCAHCGAKFDE